jgi:hypothetical protein
MTQLAVRAAVCFMVCVVGASDGCESGLGVLRSTSQATPLAFPLTEDVGEQRQGRTRRDAPTVCGGLKVLEIVGYRVSLSHRSSSFLERPPEVCEKFASGSRDGSVHAPRTQSAVYGTSAHAQGALTRTRTLTLTKCSLVWPGAASWARNFRYV